MSEPGMQTTEEQRSYYDCNKCPAYCCSIYDRVQVTPRDIKRLAKHFDLDVETAQSKFTTTWQGERILRRKADPIFDKACKFLDPSTRRCSCGSGAWEQREIGRIGHLPKCRPVRLFRLS